MRPEKQKFNLQISFLNSTIFHVLFFALLFNFDFLNEQISSEQETSFEKAPVQTKIMSYEQFQELYGKNKVVETMLLPGASKETDIDAFLGEQDQKVTQQMRSQNFGSVTGREILTTPLLDSQRGKKGRQEEILEYTVPKQRGTGNLQNGSFDTIDESIQTGPLTLLNTKKYKYASFYNRVSRELGPAWVAKVKRVMRVDESAQKLDGIYVSKVVFELNSSGKILSVKLLQSSGYEAFDTAASRSVAELGEVKNPPDGLKDEKGNFELNWTFAVSALKGGVHLKTRPDPRLRAPLYHLGYPLSR